MVKHSKLVKAQEWKSKKTWLTQILMKGKTSQWTSPYIEKKQGNNNKKKLPRNYIFDSQIFQWQK